MIQQLATRHLLSRAVCAARERGRWAGRIFRLRPPAICSARWWSRHGETKIDGFQHQLSAAGCRAGFHLHGTLRNPAGAGAFKAHGLKFTKSALIALAAG